MYGSLAGTQFLGLLFILAIAGGAMWWLRCRLRTTEAELREARCELEKESERQERHLRGVYAGFRKYLRGFAEDY